MVSPMTHCMRIDFVRRHVLGWLAHKIRRREPQTARIWRQAVAVPLVLLFGCVSASAQQTAVIGRSFAGSPRFSFDADGAAGPSRYAEITNLGFRVTALATGSVVYGSTSLTGAARLGCPC